MKKHLSSISNDLLLRCSQKLDTSIDALVEEFEMGMKPEIDDYSRRLVEFCSSKALENECCNLEEKITDGSFSRFTYDMMLAWERPSSDDEETDSESIAKEKEDKKEPLKGNEMQLNDDIPPFYSDIMPLLVSEERSVGEDAFVWLASLLPLIADVVNARFTFETLTAHRRLAGFIFLLMIDISKKWTSVLSICRNKHRQPVSNWQKMNSYCMWRELLEHREWYAISEQPAGQELMKPLKNMLLWFQRILTWEMPATTFFVLVMNLVIIYKEWVGCSITVFLMCGVGMMLWARRKRMGEECNEHANLVMWSIDDRWGSSSGGSSIQVFVDEFDIVYLHD